MLISTLIDRCNRGFIASDYLRAPDIYVYMDKVIDDINSRLQATFPLMSDWVDYVTKYNQLNPDTPLDQSRYTAIPDRYLNSVVRVGVARFFYMKDEEGESVASDYFREYEGAIFAMIRDYISEVPEEFQNNTGGFVKGPDYQEITLGGFSNNGFDY